MGEGGQTSSQNNNDEDPLEDVPKVLGESPRYLLPSGDSKNKSDPIQKLPVPERPVMYSVPNGSCFSSPSSSPIVYRPMLPYSSSSSSMTEEYHEKLQDTLSYGHLPSPVANAGDSCSLVMLSSFEGKSNMSESTSAILPICRICHMPGDESEILINPCRCAGTLQFIHQNCLMKWLEIMRKKSRKPLKCELCHFQYHRHKKFKFNHFRFPKVSRQDRVLHVIFLLMLVLMIACAIATVMCFLSDKGQITKFPRNRVDLTTEEIITLSCGVLFFVSFFVAMSVQIKAKHTVYQLFLKFIMQNMEWEIDEYDKSKDSLYTNKNTYKGPPAYV